MPCPVRHDRRNKPHGRRNERRPREWPNLQDAAKRFRTANRRALPPQRLRQRLPGQAGACDVVSLLHAVPTGVSRCRRWRFAQERRGANVGDFSVACSWFVACSFFPGRRFARTLDYGRQVLTDLPILKGARWRHGQREYRALLLRRPCGNRASGLQTPGRRASAGLGTGSGGRCTPYRKNFTPRIGGCRSDPPRVRESRRENPPTGDGLIRQ
jgi:hypothetical protein